MKRLTTIIAMFLLLTATAVAQDQKRQRFNPEEFRVKMEAYIAQKANLTEAEASKVFPIFHEMKDQQRKLMLKEMGLKNKKADSDKDCQTALNEIAALHVETAKLEGTYYKKMYRVVSPKKVYNIILADDAFHREMLQHFNNRHRNDKNHRQKP